MSRAGPIKTALIIGGFTLVTTEFVFNLHALWQMRERVAALEASIEARSTVIQMIDSKLDVLIEHMHDHSDIGETK